MIWQKKQQMLTKMLEKRLKNLSLTLFSKVCTSKDFKFLDETGARPLFFVVQPFADSIYKKMTHEENELFEILDSMVSLSH